MGRARGSGAVVVAMGGANTGGGTTVDDDVANTGTGTVVQPVRAICAKKLAGDNGAPSLRTGRAMAGGAHANGAGKVDRGMPSTACLSSNSRRATTSVASVCGERNGCIISCDTKDCSVCVGSVNTLATVTSDDMGGEMKD
jgi:hypothetical protein